MTKRIGTAEWKDQPLRSFGRISGRPLSGLQKHHVEETLPHLRVPVPVAPDLVTPSRLFSVAHEVWLEIGFGGGEHLLEQARRHPEVGLIGCEPFMEGVAKAVTAIAQDQISNIRLHDDDARILLERLEPNTIDRIFILFPDPWPKRRHQKRRIIQPEFLDALARVAKPGAEVRFATDVMSYANEALAVFLADARFEWKAEQADDWRLPPADHITTRYQSKGLGDCAPVFFLFRVRC